MKDLLMDRQRMIFAMIVSTKYVRIAGEYA